LLDFYLKQELDKNFLRMSRSFEEIYDKIVEESRGNLTNQEYRDLITLEYVLTWGYDNPEDEERYKELSKKKHPEYYK
jgi:hypothetical protein